MDAASRPAAERSGRSGEDLELVGIDATHEALYRRVLALGVAAPGDVADLAGGDLSRARHALEALRSRGLVSRSGGADQYFTVDPRVALRVLADQAQHRIDALRAAIPVLAEAYDGSQSASGPHPSILFVTGGNAIGAWYGRLEQQTTDEFLAFDRPPYVLAPVNPVQESVISRGVTWRAVYAAAALDRPGAWEEIRRSVAHGELARIAPDLPVKLAISDRKVAIFSASLDPERPEAVVTEAPAVVAMLRELFEAIWERSADVPVVDGDVDFGHARGPSAHERAMLALFAAGAKDAVIARELGMSPRTLRRRSSELLQRLGAANRFQAGAEAARRGWI